MEGGRRRCIYACGAAVAVAAERAICVRSVIVTHPLNRHIMPLREREKGRERRTEEGREEAERKRRCAIATVQFHS